MKLGRLAAMAASLSLMCGAAWAADAPSCHTVKLGDVGWSDNAAINGLASVVLKSLGYSAKPILLSLPITFESLKTKDLDVFLDDWQPTMAENIAPYLKNKTVSVVGVDLTGAKYTLAVPKYVADAGVHSFADIAKHKAEFDGKIYGIEPGNDGNRLIQSVIDKNAFGLGKFTMVESSEQGMLAQVQRAVDRKQWIVFLGWEPHPMNKNFKLDYLTGGDDFFGPNLGGATIYAVTRADYAATCPNTDQLVKNMHFTLAMEDAVMDDILNAKAEPDAAAAKYLKANPEVIDAWLTGVTTADGKPGAAAVKSSVGL